MGVGTKNGRGVPRWREREVMWVGE